MTLSISHLSVSIGTRPIVHNASIDVLPGQIVGLLGPNGSGKSTILKTLYRIWKPTEGTIELDGHDLLAMPAREAAKRVAVVSQESVVEFDVSVYEMVMIGRTPHKKAFSKTSNEDREVVEEALERVGCLELRHRGFNSLSGGEKQRVLIARAISQKADHLLLDEPTNHLDIRYQIEVLELVAELGLTTLAALHDLNMAALFCDVIYLLSEGAIVASGLPKTVLTSDQIANTYGAHVAVQFLDKSFTPSIIPKRKTRSHGQ